VQGFARLGKNRASYLVDSVDLVQAKRRTPIAIQILRREIDLWSLNRLKLYFMYDTFFVPPL
jgi:hypothetical protein